MVQLPGGSDEQVGEIGEDAPVAMLVGMGEVVARDAAAKPHVIELGLLRPQAGFDVAQAFTVG